MFFFSVWPLPYFYWMALFQSVLWPARPGPGESMALPRIVSCAPSQSLVRKLKLNFPWKSSLNDSKSPWAV